MNQIAYRAILGAALVLHLLAGHPVPAGEEGGGDAGKPPPTCSGPEAGQFDFWVGEWALSWGDGKRGTNSIRKTLDGCVIREEFDGTPSIRLRGMSVSSYDAREGKWRQTWVDNQGGYLDFTGEYRDGRMILQRSATDDGKPILQRMVWYDITPDRLKWNWERSRDGGRTWEVLWKISYTRKP